MPKPSKKRLSDEEVYEMLQQSPIAFIEVMWNITPQPLKPEFQRDADEAIADCNWKAFKKRWFEPFIKGEHMTWQQWVILLSLEAAVAGRAPKRISIRSGHGIGKDCTLAWVILWFLFCFKDCQIPCTAPTAALLADVLWKEIAKWHRRMPDEVKAKYDMRSEYIRMMEHPKEWFARATTGVKENPEALAGVHADHVLRVSDEASGVADEIYNTAEGAMTSKDSYFILISNPTRLEGYFYESQINDSRYQRLAFNGEDSPIVDRDYVEGIENKHGRDSDEFRKRVLGEFPISSIELDGWTPLITKAELEIALDSEGVEHSGLKTMGADVGEGVGRDFSTIVLKSLTLMELLFISNQVDTIAFVGTLMLQIKQHEVNPQNCGYDRIGVGSGGYTTLHKEKIPVWGVNVTEKPKDTKMFDDIKAEAYWSLRNWIKAGGKIKPSKDTEGKERWMQLTHIFYKTTDAGGKIIIMSKSEMHRKGMNSPDIAEAAMLSCATPNVRDPQITKQDIFFARKMLLKKKKS